MPHKEIALELAALLPLPRRKPTFLGKMAYRLLRQPRKIWSQGIGYHAQAAACHASLRRNIRKGSLIAPYCEGESELAPISYLIGARFLEIGLISAYSLRANVDAACQITFFDDGSLTPAHVASLQEKVPGCIVRSYLEWSPPLADQFERLQIIPHLRAGYPHINKILIHLQAPE